MLNKVLRASYSLVVISVLFIGGCSGGSEDEPGIVGYVAGKPQLESYKKARTKIEDINKASKERSSWEE